jgi:hypothetical protein
MNESGNARSVRSWFCVAYVNWPSRGLLAQRPHAWLIRWSTCCTSRQSLAEACLHIFH